MLALSVKDLGLLQMPVSYAGKRWRKMPAVPLKFQSLDSKALATAAARSLVGILEL